MRHFLILLVAAGMGSGIFFVDPIAQDETYHRFADAREIFGIPNFWNVISNALFVMLAPPGCDFAPTSNSAEFCVRFGIPTGHSSSAYC